MQNPDYRSAGRRLVTVKSLSSTPGYECFSESALRHLMFNAEDRKSSKGELIKGNGLARAIVRLGRRVLIDLDEFDAWLDEHRDTVVGG